MNPAPHHPRAVSTPRAARITRPSSLLVLAVVVTLAFGAMACSPRSQLPRAWSAGDAPAARPLTRAALGHTSWTQTFVDPSRPAVLTHSPSLPSRTLVTAIYRPNGTGQFPLILFAHGALGNPAKFTKLFAAWADAGYVVVAPTFPLTNDHAPELRLNDAAQQPADMSFVLDNVLAMDKQRGSQLFRTIDHHRIGAGGLSLGGYTTYVLVYGDCCRDARIRAVEILDGTERALALDGHVPLLIAHSDTDPTIPYSSARDSFNSASPPAWLLTLHGASHASEWEDDVTPYDHIAEQVTTDFWDATLKRNHRPRAFTRLQQDATVPGLSSIESKH